MSLTDTAKEAKLFNIKEYHADGGNNVVFNDNMEFADVDEAIQWVKDNLIPDEWLADLQEDGDDMQVILYYDLSKKDMEEMSGEEISDEDYEKSEVVTYSWYIDDITEDL